MKDMTSVNIVLDRSGSMDSIGEEAVGMFNRFLEEQQALPDYAELSLVQFDDLYEENYINQPIKDCPKLIYRVTYEPRGMTALLDAIGKSINTVGQALSAMDEADRPKRVLFVILTDGYENASEEFNYVIIREMIERQKTKYNWDFIFLGAGIDAISEGAKFGLDFNKCAAFSHSAKGMNVAGQSVSSYTTTYRTTGDVTNSVNGESV